MPETEKIGSDVLDYERKPTRMDKRKQELLEKAKEEVKKKKKLEEEEEEIIKLSKLPIPGEKPGELSPEERAEIIQRAQLTGRALEEEKEVYVREHFRSKPKKKQEQKESFFDFP
jgi:hypothetical protein